MHLNADVTDLNIETNKRKTNIERRIQDDRKQKVTDT